MSNSSGIVKTVAAVAGVLVLFTFILRAALAPLYQEVGQMEARSGESSGGDYGGGGDAGGGDGGSNININLGGAGGWLNWAFGWAW
ncbi:MAG: hypothetical protein ACKOAL_05970, partial [Chthoniobacterales bacterium]